MNEEKIRDAAKGMLYMAVVRLMEEYPSINRLANSKSWQAVLDELEQSMTEALTRHVRPH